ncbi:MAG: glycosyltransferase [Candidatus Binatia bacterium]|nr:glycosyltransferase [Candidatus Binatia bacterium]
MQHKEFQVLSETLRKVFSSHTWRLGSPLRTVAQRLRSVLGLPDPSRINPGAKRQLAGVLSKAALLLSGCPGDAKRYRCDHLSEQLESLGVSTESATQGEIDLTDALDCFSIFVLHRVAYDRNIDWFLRKASERGAVVLFDTDDWVFDPEAYRYIDTAGMSERDQKLYRTGLERYRETIARSHGMVVSTDALFELASGLQKDVRTLPNVVSGEMMQLATAARAGTTSRRMGGVGTSVTLGYLSGTPTHRKDFAVAEEAIEWALDTYPSVRLLTVGHIDVSDRFGRFGERFQHMPLMPWQRLADTLARIDVNLAPLEPGNPFTASKSALKFLEAALVGVPTIASPMPDFRRAIDQKVTGWLAETPAEWREALGHLIESPDAAREMGESARDCVLAKHTTASQAVHALETVRSFAPSTEGRPLTINWILRAPIAGTGGGYWTIFRLANFLGAAGHRVRVYIEPIAHLEGKSHEEIEQFLEENFGPLRVQTVVGHDRILPADATIATNWPTAYTVAGQQDSLFRFYFVQDFEPEFYSDRDPLYREAERTYDLPLQHVCIGRSLAARLGRLTGRPTERIDFAVDTEIFRTQVRAADRSGPTRVLFFARPGIKRRGFDLGVEALERFARERPEVEICMFGAEDEELRGVRFPFTNLGVLGHYELARVMNEAHILLCFSLSANVSWVPLQAMACGCAVVEADVPGVREMVQSDTCLLAKPSGPEVTEALVRLVDDDDLRCRLAENAAAALAERSWESSARQFEQILQKRCFVRAAGSGSAQPAEAADERKARAATAG